ncbi:MAG TPA: LPS assembly protein LptD [Candidatus Binatia bacterium]|jgi:LPS-assembly protein
MNCKKRFYLQAAWAIVAMIWAVSSWGQSSPSETKEIDVTADSLSFSNGGTQIDAKGNVQVTRQPTTLKADEVSVNRETNDMEAKGQVSLDDPNWKVKSAEAMQFNMEKETGELQKGEVFIEQNHVSISGQKLQKFTGQTYHIDQGFFTTCVCDAGPSPWRISADEVDLTMGGSGIIKHGYFYLFDVPVLYLPYGFFPLQSERQTGFLFPEFGQSNKDGFRYQQPFFWAISKSTDATLSFDIQTKTRVGVLGEFRNKINRDSDFQFQPSFFNELWRKNADADIVDTTIASPHIPQHRWGLVGTHRYTTENDWLTYSDFAAYGDTLFTRELIERFDLPPQREREIQVSRFGRSRFGAFKDWGDTYFNGDWRFYQDFIQFAKTTLQRTPEVSFWGRRFLSGFPLEFRWSAESVSYIRRQDCPGTGVTTGQCGDGLRLDLRPEVVLPFKLASYLFGSVSVAPRETAYYLYSPVNPGDRAVSRELVEIRGNIGTTLSRVFSLGGPGAGAIRHVLEPELSYFFVPGVNQDNIPIMDGIDRVRRRNVLTLAIGNRFWRRYGNPVTSTGSDKEVESLNPFISNVQELGSLGLALGYNIAAERKGSSFRDSLTDIDINARLTPINFLTFAFDGGVNPGSWEITQARSTVSLVDPRPITRRSLDLDFTRPNSLSIGYRYLLNGPNGFLASNANINLDDPENCTINPTFAPCPGASNPKSIVGDIVASVFYHVTDNILLNANSVYDVVNNRFIGARAGVKLLSTCDCWTITLTLKHDINPAKTSFAFNFNLLGLGSQKRSSF